MDVQIIKNAFIKAKFAEPIKNASSLDFSNEVKSVLDEIDEIDFDSPYLDEFEQEYFESSELIHEEN